MTATINDERFQLAMQCLQEAELIIAKYYQSNLNVEFKSNGTEVTVVDQTVEAKLRAMIGARFPDDQIIGEEEVNQQKPNARYTWTLDPIDGTRAFSKGVPFFGTMIGCYENDGDILFGAINYPALKECAYAYRGQGTWWKAAPSQKFERVYVSKKRTWDQALVCSSGGEYFQTPEHQKLLLKLNQKAKFYRTWGDCYGYLLLSTGRAEVMVDPILHIWDIVPVKIMVEEAGGEVRQIDGSKAKLGTSAIAVCDKVFYDL